MYDFLFPSLLLCCVDPFFDAISFAQLALWSERNFQVEIYFWRNRCGEGGLGGRKRF